MLITVIEIDGQTSIYSVAPDRGVLNAKIKVFLDHWYENTVKNDSVKLITINKNEYVYLKVKRSSQ